MTDRERAEAKARELVACPKVPDATAADRMCPFGWNGCRRAAKCEAADEIADALMGFRREALEEAVKFVRTCPDVARDKLADGLLALATPAGGKEE